MSGYLNQPENSEGHHSNGPSCSMTHPTIIEKHEHAAQRVVDEPNRYTRLMLAGLMHIDISKEPIQSVINLPDGELANWNQKLLLIREARRLVREEQRLLAIGYNAFAGISPYEDNADFIDPADIQLIPKYDYMVPSMTSKAAELDTTGNGG